MPGLPGLGELHLLHVRTLGVPGVQGAQSPPEGRLHGRVRDHGRLPLPRRGEAQHRHLGRRQEEKELNFISELFLAISHLYFNSDHGVDFMSELDI